MLVDPSLHNLLAQIEAHDRNDPHDPLVRQAVRLRARDSCEYCLHPTNGQFEIGHIIPEALWPDYMPVVCMRLSSQLWIDAALTT